MVSADCSGSSESLGRGKPRGYHKRASLKWMRILLPVFWTRTNSFVWPINMEHTFLEEVMAPRWMNARWAKGTVWAWGRFAAIEAQKLMQQMSPSRQMQCSKNRAYALEINAPCLIKSISSLPRNTLRRHLPASNALFKECNASWVLSFDSKVMMKTIMEQRNT